MQGRQALGGKTNVTTLIFPFPPSDLSPNARVHWAVRAKAAKKYKTWCLLAFFRCDDQTVWEGKKAFKIEFQPPSARRGDLDNMLSAIKPGIDALSLVTNVNDFEFQFTISKAPPVKGGAVRVEAI